jgi:hypothetical protein
MAFLVPFTNNSILKWQLIHPSNWVWSIYYVCRLPLRSDQGGLPGFRNTLADGVVFGALALEQQSIIMQEEFYWELALVVGLPLEGKSKRDGT